MKRNRMKRSVTLLLLGLLLWSAVAARAQDDATPQQQEEDAQQPDAAADQAQQATDPSAGVSQPEGGGERSAEVKTEPAAEEAPATPDAADTQPEDKQPEDAQPASGTEDKAQPAAADAKPAEATPEAAPAESAADASAEQEATPQADEGSKQLAQQMAVTTPEQLQAQVDAAIQMQDNKEEVTDMVISQLVAEAPAAELASGDADVSTTGACASDFDKFCAAIQPGEGRFAECLTSQLQEEAKGNVQGNTVSVGCVAELEAFKADRATNINKDLPLAKACQRDAKRFCKKHSKDPGAVLACLRAAKPKLNPRCKKEIFRTQLEAAEDYRADAQLEQYCQGDVERVCSDVKPGGGRIQECLRENAGAVSFDCKQDLFRQDVENAGDLRLSVSLLRLCMGEKQVFCPLAEPGDAHAMECLEENRNAEGFGGECRGALEAAMERRAMDFRLDAPLRSACEKDIEKTCGLALSRLDSVQGYDGKVVRCLQDFREELQVPECREQVHKSMERQTEDVRFNYPLASDCAEDRKKLCPDEQPGSARVIRCLQESREQLSFECRAALFDQEQDMAEDIDFKFPLRAACASEIPAFCKDVRHGHARIVRCLQDVLEDAAMGGECRQQVEADLIRSSSDYRLNFRLREACEADVSELCPDVCKQATNHACGGRALRCLSDKAAEISSAACRKEVFYFQKMEVFDFRNDVILAEACRNDVDRFCKKVEPGEGRVHDCLRKNRDKLSDSCRQEELHLNIMQAQDVRLRPKLKKLCSQEIAVYCADVKPGRGRIMHCLQQSLPQPDFGPACAEQIIAREIEMQADWHEDYGVATACGADIADVCAEEEGRAHGKSEVLKCLLAQLEGLQQPCQWEVSRAARMALWEYTPGATLTECCDRDVSLECEAAGAGHKRGVFSIGAVGRCLAKKLAVGAPLDPSCRELVMAAAPSDSRAVVAANAAQSALKEKVKELQARAREAATANDKLVSAKLVNPEAQGANVITLSGWIAAAALAAMGMVVIVGAYLGIKRLVAPSRPYTVVATRDGDA